MTISVIESPSISGSLEAKTGSMDVPYLVSGVTDEVTAVALVLSIAPLVRDGLIRQTAKWKQTSYDIYEVETHYGDEADEKSKEKPKPGTWEYSFDTGQASHKITQSIKTIWRGEESASNPAPDMKGAINVTDSGVEGVEIQVPDARFSITAYFRPQDVTTQLFFDFEKNAFKTNDGPWLGADEGELLFLGVQGRGETATVAGQKVKPAALTFSFAYSPNKPDFKVGEILVPGKKGWEYLHVRYGTFESNATALLKRPIMAWVEQVYDSIDFNSALGISESNQAK